ncbi:MAG: tRNA (guanosine(37)-N1)-methyltransferase TrmD [Candidatus Pacebacteria bacterium]|nr:tRNA (guanosine(37)-N1)-methyltransferase TrmD [Candidatus Paceibacterota bacterium]
MKINILTTFADFFTTPLQSSILQRAQDKELVEINLVDLRKFTDDQYRSTDDRPYGGGAGMVMKIEPIDRALASLAQQKGQTSQQIVLTSAKGQLFTQQTAQHYAQLKELTLICGHYQGVDERVAQHLVDAEVRIGNYVLTGGEPASLVIVDSVTRLLPGVLGNQASLRAESHGKPGQLGCPQYTRPANYRGWSVPQVLLSGDHAQIKAWKNQQRTNLS